MTRRRFFLNPFRRAGWIVDEHMEAIIAFERQWDPYVRTLLGCPDEGLMTTETCDGERSQRDYARFLKARKAAAKLFDLRET